MLRQGRIESADVWVSEGKITSALNHVDEIIDVSGFILAPGYIDLQINGGFGIDFCSQPQKVAEVAGHLPCCGVTAFLPTVISSPAESYPAILNQLRQAMRAQESACFKNTGAQILGIHLEGPFFSPSFKGAHDLNCLQSAELDPATLYGDLEGVKIMTLAPELAGALGLIAYMHAQGIIVSAGHTAASAKELEAAIQAGLGCATHLFNAMPPFHHREPGIVGAILTHPYLPFTLIADSFHVHAHAIELAWRARADGLILISDAIAALGASATHLGTMGIEVFEGKAVIRGSTTLAGSTHALDSGVRYLWKSTGCSRAAALEAASLKPAQLLGLAPIKGTLEPGADADMIILDDELHVHGCYINGETAWDH